MKGLIYIASAFETVNRSECGRGTSWVDNDPHFWDNAPPTWGICRPDLRERAEEGDYIFYVLSENSNHSPMIFAYMKIKKIITHLKAYHRADLISKRMSDQIPNGNIIVDENGDYNIYDDGYHEDNFDRIKKWYAIGDTSNSHFFDHRNIERKTGEFFETLKSVLRSNKKIDENTKALDFISTYGQTLDEDQMNELLDWLMG